MWWKMAADINNSNAAYMLGVVIRLGSKILSFAVSIISYPTIVKNKTITSPLIASARP